MTKFYKNHTACPTCSEPYKLVESKNGTKECVNLITANQKYRFELDFQHKPFYKDGPSFNRVRKLQKIKLENFLGTAIKDNPRTTCR